MKAVICAACALLITACAGTQTLEELEAEALRTGDWSAVEEREALIAKRNSRRPQQCSAGLVSVCEKNLGRYTCQCLTRSNISQVFASH